jgi:hypothetical protein
MSAVNQSEYFDNGVHGALISDRYTSEEFEKATLQLAVGNDIVMSCDISLEASATEELLGWIERNMPKIKASGFKRVSFENVSTQLQQRIKALLNA